MSAPPQASAAPLLARAAQLLKAGRAAEAIGALRDAARLLPSDPGVHHDLGVACLESGRPAEAIAALERAVAINPRFAKAHLRLGMARETLGSASQAIEAYRAAVGLLPSLTEAAFRAGSLLETLGHRQEALALFRRAASASSRGSLARIAAARALLLEDRDREAERVLRQVLALDAANAMALDLLGSVLADAGRFAEAADCFERAIAQAPLLAGSYYDLVRCRTITPADAPLVARLRAALARPGLEAGQRVRVHLAMGKAAEDLGDHAEAMRNFDAADAIRRGLVGFDPAAFDALADRLIAHFTPGLIARASALERVDQAPLLILGMPRSGTTLVEQIVSSHPAVAAGGELPFWGERGGRWAREASATTDTAFLAEAASDYGRLLRAIAPDAAFVTDKMPLNLMWAGLIHMAFPRATILHCRRDPLDTALSIHQTYFNPRLGFPTGGPELVAFTRTFGRLAEHWRRVLPADRFIDVDYEALTASPETATRSLIASCGLDCDPACLRPQDNARVVRTPSKWQVRQPIHANAVGRWRRYEPWLGPLRDLIDAG